MKTWNLALLVVFLLPAMISCATSNGSNAPQSTVTPFANTIVRHITPLEQPRPSETAGDFYVSLAVSSNDWHPQSISECVDSGFISWMRQRLLGSQAGQVSVDATIAVNNPSINNKRIPLFLVGKREASSAGPASCYSLVLDRQILPWVRADSQTEFDVRLKLTMNNSYNFIGADSIRQALTAFTSYANYSGPLVNFFMGSVFNNESNNLNSSISSHLSQSTQNDYEIAFRPFGQYQHVEMFAPSVVATASGVNLTSTNSPVMKIGMIYKASLFAGPNGIYPTLQQVLTQRLAPGDGAVQQNLATLVQTNQIGNVGLSNLQGISSGQQSHSICSSIKNALSGLGFSTKDELVARFAILYTYAPQVFSNDALMNDMCLNAAEKSALTQLQYTVITSGRSRAHRNDEIDERLYPILVALLNADRTLLINNTVSPPTTVRLVTLDNVVGLNQALFPNAPSSVEGEDAIDQMLSLFGGRARIGCFRASRTGSLNTIAAVARISNTSFGLLFYFDNDGRLTQLWITTIDQTRSIGQLGAIYPGTSCALAGVQSK